MSDTRKPEQLLVGLVLALLVWLPLPLGSNRDWSMGLLVALVGALTLLWSIGLLRQGGAGQRTNPALRHGLPLFGLLLLAQAWVAVQWLGGLSADPGATFRALLLGLSYSLLFLLVISLFHTRKRLQLLLAVLVVSGTLQAFEGAFAVLSRIEWLQFGSGGHVDATGSFVNRNHLAGYLELTLACGIGLLLALRSHEPFRWRSLPELLMSPKARLRLALVVMVIGLVMTHSRGGNAGFFFGLLAAGALFALRDPQHRRRNLLVLLSILLVDLLVVSQYFGLERLRERIASTQLEDRVEDGRVLRSANELRDDVIRQALPLLLARPLAGQGAGSFEAVFPAYPDQRIPLHYDHAHNDYLQFFIEFGLPGFLPLALFALLSLGHALRALCYRESLFCSGVGLGASLGIIAIGIHSFTDFNLQIPANAATFVVLCAIAVLARHHNKNKRVRQVDGRESAFAAGGGG